MLQTREKISTLLPFAALSAAVILWGGSFVGMRVVLRELSPMAVMWARMILALVSLLPLAGKLVPRDYRKGDWKMLLPMVCFQPCLYFLLESNALLLTTSTQAGVIAASVPVMVAIGAWIFFSESINKLTVTGLVMSVSGVIFLTLSQGGADTAVNPVAGNIMEAGAMVFAAANMLLIKKLSGRYSPLTLTAMQIAAGTLFFLPGLVQLLRVEPSLWNIKTVLILIYLGVFVSLGAFGLYNWGISRINASKASSFINLVPVTAIITGWLILGETLTPIQTAAALVVIMGVLLGQKSLRR